MAKRTVRWLVGLLVLILFFAGIFGGKLYQQRKAAERAAAQGGEHGSRLQELCKYA